jgi:hypothetical protein
MPYLTQALLNAALAEGGFDQMVTKNYFDTLVVKCGGSSTQATIQDLLQRSHTISTLGILQMELIGISLR